MPTKIFGMISTPSGYSWSMNAYRPTPCFGPQSLADNDYTPGLSADLMLKNWRLSHKAAEAAKENKKIGGFYFT